MDVTPELSDRTSYGGGIPGTFVLHYQLRRPNAGKEVNLLGSPWCDLDHDLLIEPLGEHPLDDSPGNCLSLLNVLR